MVNTITKSLSLLSAVEKRKLLGIAIVGVISALLEVVGVASIMPFMALVSNAKLIETNRYLHWGYDTFGFTSPNRYLIALGVGSFVALIFSNAFRAMTTWISLHFSHMQNHSVSRTLLDKYLSESYEFFLSRNSSELAKNIVGEASLVATNLFVPALQAFNCLVTAAMIILFLTLIDPIATVSAAGILGIVYGFIYKLFKIKIAQRGEERAIANEQRYKALSEVFGGIKDVKLMHKEPVYLQQYDKPSRRFAIAQVHNAVVGEIPNILLETVAYGVILFWMLYLLSTGKDLSRILPLLALFALAARRLLPSLKEVFRSFTKIRFNLPSLDILCGDLQGAKDCTLNPIINGTQKPLLMKTNLRLDEIGFCYAGAKKPVFNGLSLEISANTTVAFVGPTGCGKTTAVDIILGLLKPQSGRLLVDGIAITEDNIRSWQCSLGYVPQHVFLLDDTIAANIAFGIPKKSIDLEMVRRTAALANLRQFIESELPDGYDTITGERGVRLSGGQRQRIGIARALYHNPTVLVLDEATSALDNATERAVMEAIDNISGQKTIIMIAHRLSTVQNCDTIFFMTNGVIQTSGTYGDLLKQNPEFSQMAKG